MNDRGAVEYLPHKIESRVMSSTFLRRVLLIAMALGFGPMRLAGDEVVDEATVRRWVVRLDVDRKADRREAEKELLKLGPAALKWLPEPESFGSRATAEAIRKVRAELERQKAEQSVHATRLTGAGSQSVGETLQRLTKETGNIVVTDELSKELLSQPLELSERPTFWDVIEATSRRHDLSWAFAGSPARLRLSMLTAATKDESPRTALAVTQSKAFRVALKSIRERTVVGENAGPLVRLELEVMSEPRLRPLFLKCSVAEVSVTGARAPKKDEQRWQPYSPDAKLELTFGQGGRQMSVPLDFRRPDGVWSSLSVSGQLHVETAAGEESMEFPAGAEARPAFESHRSWMLFNVAGLVRAGMMPNEKPANGAVMNDVNLLKPTHTESDVQPDGSIAVTYRFEKLPLPPSEYRFRYVAPTLILDVPLDFELRDVPLRTGR
ncbi:MAG: hypothetical protein FD138_4101 [Planctomycetota bacterium]|nr:MAG: hypothetical protein FD138_4101 [Planctomycetota bacterium]